MADIASPGSYTKMNDVEINQDAVISEALFFKVGQQINKLIDDTGTLQTPVYEVSSSSGAFNLTGTVFLDVTNLSVSITTTGRPVVIQLISDATSNASYISGQGQLLFLRGSTTVGLYQIGYNAASSQETDAILPSPVAFDVPSAGTYTYKMQAKNFSLSATYNQIDVYYKKLVVYEI